MYAHSRFHTALTAYQPSSKQEKRFKRCMQDLLVFQQRAFWRDSFDPGHFTGSALVTNAARDKVLLMHHKYLARWVQFGGHADGDPDLAAVALREAAEESGFPESAFTPAHGGIFDLDIHLIPANPLKNEPEHLHFDVRYLFRADDATPLPPNPEGLQLRWMTVPEAASLVSDKGAVDRMLRKLEGR